jgi:hypothetical protein
MSNIIQEYWAVISAFALTVLWFGRIEGKGKNNSEAILRLERRMDRTEDETREVLKEIRDDIKRLIERK